MRTMAAQTTSGETYGDAREAVLASITTDKRLRGISDEEIRGNVIRRFLWDDSALTLELEGGRYLNVVAQSGKIRCSLDEVPAAVVQPVPDNEVMLELDGHAIEWRRAELSQKYVGKPLERLWFGDGVIYLYVEQAVLACHLVVSCAEAKPWLFWTESE